MAAVGGLGQGAVQGFQVGADLAMQKQKMQQQKQHDAMNLLMQGIKAAPDDPDQAKPYWDFFGQVFKQTTGKEIPPQLMAQAQPWTERFKKAFTEAKTAFPQMSEPEINNIVLQKFGMKPMKEQEEKVPWTSPVDGKTYMLKPGEAARAGIQASQGGDRIGLGQAGLDLRQKGLEQSESHFQQKQASETTKETSMTPAETTTFASDWQSRLDKAKGPEEVAEIKAQIQGIGGDVKTISVPGALWGTNKKNVVVPPATKKQVTTRGPWGGGTQPSGPLQFPRNVKVKGKVVTVNNQEEYNKAKEDAAK